MHNKITNLGVIRDVIQSLNVKQKFQVFMSEDHNDCESAVSNFNSIMYDTALMSTKFIKRRTVKRQITSKKKPWFSESCFLSSILHFLLNFEGNE
jgi:hypothetical protein